MEPEAQAGPAGSGLQMDAPVRLRLDRERVVRWTRRAEARLGRLEQPPRLAELFSRNPHRALYTLCAWLWAAVEDPAEELGAPEVLADFMTTPEQQAEAVAALYRALRAAGVLRPEKKTAPSGSGGGPRPSGGGPTSSPGRRRSSNSGRRARIMPT